MAAAGHAYGMTRAAPGISINTRKETIEDIVIAIELISKIKKRCM